MPEIFANPQLIIDFLVRFLFNLVIVYLIVETIYYPLNKNRDLAFSYMLFGTMIFLICYFLGKTELSVGFGFGLFALFSVMRYRTETIQVKDMTYFFIVTSLAVVNAVNLENFGYLEIGTTNLIILGLIFIVEKVWSKKQELFTNITYENVDLITPDKRNELITDLCERTGLDVYKVDIIQYNFLNDTVQLKVYYRSAG